MRAFWMVFLWVWFVGVAPARAYDVEFCVDVDVQYDWSSSGGDRWVDNAVDKAARGFDYIVADGYPGTVYDSGTLATNDADAGCTGPVPLAAGNYILLVFPSGTVQGNDFEHRDGTLALFGPLAVSANVTHDLTIVLTDASWEQAVAVAYGLNLHPAGNSGNSFPISAGAGGCGGSSTNRGTEYDWVHYGWGLYAYGSDNVADDGDELTAAQIVDIWVAAAPTTWDATGATTPTDSNDDPWGRWDSAATTANGGAYAAAHGQHEGAVDH